MRENIISCHFSEAACVALKPFMEMAGAECCADFVIDALNSTLYGKIHFDQKVSPYSAENVFFFDAEGKKHPGYKVVIKLPDPRWVRSLQRESQRRGESIRAIVLQAVIDYVEEIRDGAGAGQRLLQNVLKTPATPQP